MFCHQRSWIALSKRAWSVAAIVLAASAMCWSGAAQAQTGAYPNHAVRFIVPYPPGGITDILARLIAQKVTQEWGQSMYVENRPGASGNIGVADAAKAAPDGYTILFGNAATHAINPSLFKNLHFDPIKDFAPVTMVARVSNVLLVAKDSPIKSVGDLIKMAKAKPGELSFASNGVGSSNHLTGEFLKTAAGIDLTHIPYKSSTNAVVDLIGGRVSMMIDNITTAMPYLKDGRLRALVVTSAKRIPALPNVPTMAESGLPDFVVTPWWGIFAPAGTPEPIIAKLNRDIVKVLHTPDVRAFLDAQATEVVGDSPQEFAAFVRGEADRWHKVVVQSGATAE